MSIDTDNNTNNSSSSLADQYFNGNTWLVTNTKTGYETVSGYSNHETYNYHDGSLEWAVYNCNDHDIITFSDELAGQLFLLKDTLYITKSVRIDASNLSQPIKLGMTWTTPALSTAGGGLTAYNYYATMCVIGHFENILTGNDNRYKLKWDPVEIIGIDFTDNPTFAQWGNWNKYVVFSHGNNKHFKNCRFYDNAYNGDLRQRGPEGQLSISNLNDENDTTYFGTTKSGVLIENCTFIASGWNYQGTIYNWGSGNISYPTSHDGVEPIDIQQCLFIDTNTSVNARKGYPGNHLNWTGLHPSFGITLYGYMNLYGCTFYIPDQPVNRIVHPNSSGTDANNNATTLKTGYIFRNCLVYAKPGITTDSYNKDNEVDPQFNLIINSETTAANQVFENAEKLNFNLAFNSPAINTGKNTFVTGQWVYDFSDYFDRVQGGRVDAGAFEFGSQHSTVVTTTDNDLEGSLNYIINHAYDNETITFLPELSGKTIYLYDTLRVTKKISIDASNLQENIILDCNGKDIVALHVDLPGNSDPLYIKGVDFTNSCLSDAVVVINSGNFTIDGCRFYQNNAENIIISTATLLSNTLMNLMIFSNTYNNSIVLTDGLASTYITQCLIANNFSSIKTVPRTGVIQTYLSVILTNTTVANNEANYAIYTHSENAVDNNRNSILLAILGGTGGLGNIYNKSSYLNTELLGLPQINFESPDELKYQLSSNSIALNNGDNYYVSWSEDLAGNTRIKYSLVDMGCYELELVDSEGNPVVDDRMTFLDDWTKPGSIAAGSGIANLVVYNCSIDTSEQARSCIDGIVLHSKTKINPKNTPTNSYNINDTRLNTYIFATNIHNNQNCGIYTLSEDEVISDNCDTLNSHINLHIFNSKLAQNNNAGLSCLNKTLCNTYKNSAECDSDYCDNTSRIYVYADQTFFSCNGKSGIYAFNSAQCNMTNSQIINTEGNTSCINFDLSRCRIRQNNRSGLFAVAKSDQNYKRRITFNATNTQIADNIGINGGGVFSEGYVDFIFNTSILEENTATQNGGGAFCDTAGDLKFNTCEIKNNASINNGSGLYKKGAGKTYIVNSVIDGNYSSQGYGGALYYQIKGYDYVRTIKARITNSTIAGNVAVAGGGVYVTKPITYAWLPSEFIINNSYLDCNFNSQTDTENNLTNTVNIQTTTNSPSIFTYDQTCIFGDEYVVNQRATSTIKAFQLISASYSVIDLLSHVTNDIDWLDEPYPNSNNFLVGVNDNTVNTKPTYNSFTHTINRNSPWSLRLTTISNNILYNAGLNTLAVNVDDQTVLSRDLRQNARIIGRVDIGAYEYGSRLETPDELSKIIIQKQNESTGDSYIECQIDCLPVSFTSLYRLSYTAEGITALTAETGLAKPISFIANGGCDYTVAMQALGIDSPAEQSLGDSLWSDNYSFYVPDFLSIPTLSVKLINNESNRIEYGLQNVDKRASICKIQLSTDNTFTSDDVINRVVKVVWNTDMETGILIGELDDINPSGVALTLYCRACAADSYGQFEQSWWSKTVEIELPKTHNNIEFSESSSFMPAIKANTLSWTTYYQPTGTVTNLYRKQTNTETKFKLIAAGVSDSYTDPLETVNVTYEYILAEELDTLVSSSGDTNSSSSEMTTDQYLDTANAIYYTEAFSVNAQLTELIITLNETMPQLDWKPIYGVKSYTIQTKHAVNDTWTALTTTTHTQYIDTEYESGYIAYRISFSYFEQSYTTNEEVIERTPTTFYLLASASNETTFVASTGWSENDGLQTTKTPKWYDSFIINLEGTNPRTVVVSESNFANNLTINATEAISVTLKSSVSKCYLRNLTLQGTLILSTDLTDGTDWVVGYNRPSKIQFNNKARIEVQSANNLTTTAEGNFNSHSMEVSSTGSYSISNLTLKRSDIFGVNTIPTSIDTLIIDPADHTHIAFNSHITCINFIIKNSNNKQNDLTLTSTDRIDISENIVATLDRFKTNLFISDVVSLYLVGQGDNVVDCSLLNTKNPERFHIVLSKPYNGSVFITDTSAAIYGYMGSTDLNDSSLIAAVNNSTDLPALAISNSSSLILVDSLIVAKLSGVGAINLNNNLLRWYSGTYTGNISGPGTLGYTWLETDAYSTPTSDSNVILRDFSPEAPVATLLAGTIANHYTLSWSAIEGATSYVVYRSTTVNFIDEEIIPVDGLSYDTGVISGVVYFKVAVANVRGYKTFSNIVSWYQWKLPDTLTATPVSTTSIKVEWSTDKNIPAYELLRATINDTTGVASDYTLLGYYDVATKTFLQTK